MFLLVSGGRRSRERESFSLAPGSLCSSARNSHVLRSHETNMITCSLVTDIFILAIIRGNLWQCGKNHIRARDLASRLRETANVTLPFHVSRKIA